MSIEIRKKQKGRWAVRLLVMLVCASAMAGGVRMAGAAESAGKTIAKAAKPARASQEGISALNQERIHNAVALEESVATTRWTARVVALVGFAACVLGLWWLSARWLRYRFLQWLALIALPSLIALAIFKSSQGSVEHSLDKLPRDWLLEAKKHPQMSAARENRDAFQHALALHDANETSLLPALAMRPTVEIAGGALFLALLLWQLTHRRVLQST